jgi:uncharacterized protein (UPF0261 family)
MEKKVLILVMAEEKWREADFLRKEMEERGPETAILDMGLTGQPQGKCHITREAVIAASGRDPDEVAAITDRGKRMPVMVEGGRHILKEMHSRGELAGVISLGGATGTQMATSMMKALPFGVPKVALSSTAANKGLASRYMGTADITLMHSVVEFGGLDRLMKNNLARAAGAICGMVDASHKNPIYLQGKQEKPLIAMTHFGPCERCAMEIRKQLENKGYEVVGFSASGFGDRAMDELMEQMDIFRAVIDIVPAGVGEELLGFARAAGTKRLEVAARKGIPQVISTCGVNFGSPRKRAYLPEYENRKKYEYDALRAFVRLSSSELLRVAQVMAGKINQARGPVKVVIPLGGWSSVDTRGSDFYDGEADRRFTVELKRHLRQDIEVREVDADLDTPEFAREMVRAFNEVIQGVTR